MESTDEEPTEEEAAEAGVPGVAAEAAGMDAEAPGLAPQAPEMVETAEQIKPTTTAQLGSTEEEPTEEEAA